jgi:hypothetical protein
MKQEDFRRAGETLYGEKWREPLSKALDISPSTAWRYWRGKLPIPTKVELAVQKLLDNAEREKARH